MNSKLLFSLILLLVLIIPLSYGQKIQGYNYENGIFKNGAWVYDPVKKTLTHEYQPADIKRVYSYNDNRKVFESTIGDQRREIDPVTLKGATYYLDIRDGGKVDQFQYNPDGTVESGSPSEPYFSGSSNMNVFVADADRKYQEIQKTLEQVDRAIDTSLRLATQPSTEQTPQSFEITGRKLTEVQRSQIDKAQGTPGSLIYLDSNGEIETKIAREETGNSVYYEFFEHEEKLYVKEYMKDSQGSINSPSEEGNVRRIPNSVITALQSEGATYSTDKDPKGRQAFIKVETTKVDSSSASTILMDVEVTTKTTTTGNADETYTRSVEETSLGCPPGCDKKNRKEWGKAASSATYRKEVVGEGDDAQTVEVPVESTRGLYNIQLFGGAENLGSIQTMYKNSPQDIKEGRAGYSEGYFYKDSKGNNLFAVDETGGVFVAGEDGKLTEGPLSSSEVRTKLESAGFDSVWSRNRIVREMDREIINKPGFSFGAKLGALGWGGVAGGLLKAYDEYQGIEQVTNLIWSSNAERSARLRQRIAQDFCLAAGIENCLVGTICGSIYPLKANNIVVGRGPTGQILSSASLNAERSLPAKLEGLTRQQIIDMIGANSTVIDGIKVDLTNPNLDLSKFGRINLRLYHVQYSLTNNAQNQEELKYNLEFKRTKPAKDVEIEEQKLPSSMEEPGFEEALKSPIKAYATPLNTARWYPKDMQLKYGKKAQSNETNKYKYSFGEWDTVCLKFKPGLPSGSGASTKFVDNLCVPFVEYAGGPTEIHAINETNAKGVQETSQNEGEVFKTGNFSTGHWTFVREVYKSKNSVMFYG